MTWNGPTVGVMRPGMLAVSGCRPPKSKDIEEWRIYEAIALDVIAHVEALDMRVAHGGAIGVDQTAALASTKRGERYLPNYKRDGDAAPMIRNAYVTTTERFCAWPAPWSRGTWDAVKKRLKACGNSGFEMRVVGVDVDYWQMPRDVDALIKNAGATYLIVT